MPPSNNHAHRPAALSGSLGILSIVSVLGLVVLQACHLDQKTSADIMTVERPMPASALGRTLTHEHILVGQGTYHREEVVRRVLPYLREVRNQGWDAFIDCTPSHLGRDPLLLRELSRLSGLQILTNTGFYGGSNEALLPPLALQGSDRQIADFWTREFFEGIDGSGIRPGFIKISVNPSTLSGISRKLVRAAALTHLKTGLTIVSHTGPASPAFEQIAILKEAGVSPSAFVWTHAQAEKDRDRSLYLKAAREGCWISLDDLAPDNVQAYAELLQYLKTQGCLERILLSHDAGWYKPGEENGGSFRGFGTLHAELLPALKARNFTPSEIDLLLRKNPAAAFGIRLRPFPDKT